MNVDLTKWYVHILHSHLKKYNHEKYWKIRAEVINPDSKKPKWLRILYLYKIKKADAFNNASMGTDLGHGAIFDSPPILPHGLNGIIIAHDAKFGYNCTILQQVTIAYGDNDTAATIGNNCLIGTGAKIIGGVTIGDNVRIGANAVVVNDIPSNCTAVGVPARIIHRDIKN